MLGCNQQIQKMKKAQVIHKIENLQLVSYCFSKIYGSIDTAHFFPHSNMAKLINDMHYQYSLSID